MPNTKRQPKRRSAVTLKPVVSPQMMECAQSWQLAADSAAVAIREQRFEDAAVHLAWAKSHGASLCKLVLAAG